MTSLTRRAFFSPELSLALDPAHVRSLFSAFAGRARAPAEPVALARALWDQPLPFLLADALDEIARFAHPAGRDALLEAGRDSGEEHDDWEAETPVDLAARLLAGRMHWHYFERARFRLARMRVAGHLAERPTYELRGARWPVPGSRDGLPEALRAAAGTGAGWSDAWVNVDEQDGTVRAVLLYAAPADGGCELSPTGPTRRARRTLLADLFRHTPADGRLIVTTARPHRLGVYAKAWGRALHGEHTFFDMRPSLTLKPLLALGAHGLEHARLPEGVSLPRVIACQLDTGAPERLDVRGPNALERIAPLVRGGGYFTRAILRFDVDGARDPVDAMLELPNRVAIGGVDAAAGVTRGANLVREAVATLGLLSPGAIADDVTSLLPLVHPEWRWRELVGEEALAAMKAAGLMEHVAGEAVRRAATEEMRAAGRSAIAYRLYERPKGAQKLDYEPAAEYYAVPEDWATQARTLAVHQLAMARVDLPAVVAKGRKELGLSRGVRPKLPKGVLWIGEMVVPDGVVRFFYVVRAAVEEREKAALGKAIARATRFGRPVVFVPAGRKLGRDYLEIELDVREQLGAKSWRSKMEAVVRELDLEEEIAAERLAPEDARVVVDRRLVRVAIDGAPMVRMPDSAVRLLGALAGKSGQFVTTRDADRAVSGARQTEGAARQTVFKMKRWIRESFAAAGKTVPRDLGEDGIVEFVKGKGWRLRVKGVVRREAR